MVHLLSSGASIPSTLAIHRNSDTRPHICPILHQRLSLYPLRGVYPTLKREDPSSSSMPLPLETPHSIPQPHCRSCLHDDQNSTLDHPGTLAHPGNRVLAVVHNTRLAVDRSSLVGTAEGALVAGMGLVQSQVGGRRMGPSAVAGSRVVGKEMDRRHSAVERGRRKRDTEVEVHQEGRIYPARPFWIVWWQIKSSKRDLFDMGR
jgi:hypothetical protein